MTLSDRNAALNQSILNKACLALYAKMSNFSGTMSQALTLMDPPPFARSVEILPKISQDSSGYGMASGSSTSFICLRRLYDLCCRF